MIVRRSYSFEASHQLPQHPGKCANLHGHSYRFVVEVSGDLDPVQGLVIDFWDLDKIVHEAVLDRVDHQHLNEVIENPTAEWIAIWIWRQLRPALEGLESVELFEVEGASALYRGEYERGGA
jgi:6-pyruvoyltetrahydropterin/6-carboxytetrahydropterin synthase